VKDFKMLTYETIPCWYELSFYGVNRRPGLLLRIHTDFANRTKEIPADVPGVVNFMELFGFKKFSGKFGGNLGFEECLAYLGTKDNFLEYEIPAPLVKKFKDGPCAHCGGTGRSEDLDRECLYCENGKESYYDYDAAFAVSATLTLFFEFMRFPDCETTAKIPQLMTVGTSTTKESGGWYIGGDYSCELAAYLRSRPNGTIPEMVLAMQIVHERMEGEIKSFYSHSFRAYTQGNDGWLNVDCPGDACGLHPANCHTNGDRGYEFTCHNVDQPIQQFTLLASLAALHDLARLKA